MPRKAPNEVIEHRISLSNFERDLLVRTIKEQQESRYWTAGINQIGQIAGSGVLLYGIATYFGINLLSKATDATKAWVDRTSTNLSDVVGGLMGIPTTAQATYIRRGFDALDKIIIEMRERESANQARFDGGMVQLRNGDITYDEFYNNIFLPVKAEEADINDVRAKVVKARQALLTYQEQIYEARSFDGLSGNIPLDLMNAILAFA